MNVKKTVDYDEEKNYALNNNENKYVSSAVYQKYVVNNVMYSNRTQKSKIIIRTRRNYHRVHFNYNEKKKKIEQ